jgi:hypothetical protein
MEVTHRGYLWVEDPISIDVDPITYIIGLPPQGETPEQFLDAKTKEKSLAKEITNTYGTERGSHIIITKHISDVATRMATKIMLCKLLRKCFKEEVPVGVVVAATQCVEGTILSWDLYLLIFFLEDYKTAQDLGTKFHYSFLLVLIALVGWRGPKYTWFSERSNHCHAT